MCFSCQLTHQFGLLCIYRLAELQQRLELIIFGECDNLHHCPKLGEDLKEKRCTSNASLFTQCFFFPAVDILKVFIYLFKKLIGGVWKSSDLLQDVQCYRVEHVIDDDA